MLEAHRAVDAVWRLESARIIAGLARIVRDVGLAEDLAQEALVAALRQWPESGIPPNPGAWLMATAKHQAVDRLRRDERLQRNVDLLSRELHSRQQAAIFGGSPDLDAVTDDDFVPDDVLRLMFVACHPVLSAEARVALTLRLIGGLSTAEIARAFLAAEPRSPSGSSAPSGPWPTSRSRSRFRPPASARPGSRRCSKSST